MVDDVFVDCFDYTVWVGGMEVNDCMLLKEDAEELAESYREDGYTDVIVENVEERSVWTNLN